MQTVWRCTRPVPTHIATTSHLLADICFCAASGDCIGLESLIRQLYHPLLYQCIAAVSFTRCRWDADGKGWRWWREEEWEIKTWREQRKHNPGFPVKHKRDIYLTEKVRGGKIHWKLNLKEKQKRNWGGEEAHWRGTHMLFGSRQGFRSYAVTAQVRRKRRRRGRRSCRWKPGRSTSQSRKLPSQRRTPDRAAGGWGFVLKLWLSFKTNETIQSKQWYTNLALSYIWPHPG